LKTPEAAIKDQIRKWLKEQGAYVFSPTQMGYGMQTVDLLACWGGLFIAIEVKAPGKKPTARQLQILGEIDKARGKAIWVDSLQSCKSQLVEIIDTIEGLKDSEINREIADLLTERGY
jgi:hypothetical protein